MVASGSGAGQKRSSGKKTSPVPASFNEESMEYYPPACCELIHITNAVYLATLLQVVAMVMLTVLYYVLERNSFLSALEIFRPAVGFVVCVNLVGIVCAVSLLALERGSNGFLKF
jgi:hypothetical protein